MDSIAIGTSKQVENRWMSQAKGVEKGPFKSRSSKIRQVFVSHAPHLGHLACICVRLDALRTTHLAANLPP